FLLGRFGCHRLVREPRGLQRAALGAAWRRIRNAVSETRARHRAADSFIAAGAVPVSRSARQRRRAETIDVRCFVWIALAGHTVMIVKYAGVTFVNGGNYRLHGNVYIAMIFAIYI